MASQSWDDLETIFEHAKTLPPDARAAYLDDICAGRPALRRELAELLACADDAEDFFDSFHHDVFVADDTPSGASSNPHDLSGATIRQYQVLEKLGQGGMGVVYKARDTHLDRFVALKFLPSPVSADDEAKARFIGEAKAASALDHVNICTIHEIGETDDGRFFIAMSYYEGETLKKMIGRGALPLGETLTAALQMARGLAKAHARGIIHRDIKPANVIITSDGVAKILDFGLAKVMGGLTLTRTGMTMGTVAYMSPEQAQGRPVDHRTDIWSLGVVLYEMLTGQRPFIGDYEQAVVYAIHQMDPQPVTGLRSGLPMQLAHLVHKALAKPLPERYNQMDEVLADLEAVQQQIAARFMPAQQPGPEAAPLPGEATPPGLATTVFQTAHAPDAPRHKPVKILVVDDAPQFELLIIQRFRKKIRANEWAFVFAKDGVEALDTVLADPEIGVVLTDIKMPRMDGLTLLTKLAGLDRLLKTVVVSAYGDMENIRTAMNRGAFDFVTKPIDLDDLETTVSKAVQELQVFKKAVQAQHQLVSLRKELDVARRLQEAVLPYSFPERDDFEIHAFMEPARDVSGDFYDFFLIEDNRLGFAIGSLAGKGVLATLFTVMSRTLLRAIAAQDVPPGACLQQVKTLLFPKNLPGIAVSVFYGVLDVKTGAIAYCNAGQQAPYLLRAGGIVMPLEGPAESALSPTANAEYQTRQTVLQPGEGLFLFTEGIPQAADAHDQPFSIARLASLLRQHDDAAPAETIRDVVHAVDSFMGEASPSKDLTALALRYRGP